MKFNKSDRDNSNKKNNILTTRNVLLGLGGLGLAGLGLKKMVNVKSYVSFRNGKPTVVDGYKSTKSVTSNIPSPINNPKSESPNIPNKSNEVHVPSNLNPDDGVMGILVSATMAKKFNVKAGSTLNVDTIKYLIENSKGTVHGKRADIDPLEGNLQVSKLYDFNNLDVNNYHHMDRDVYIKLNFKDKLNTEPVKNKYALKLRLPAFGNYDIEDTKVLVTTNNK